MRFIIKDWAGNTCFGGERFSDFETAWGFIYEQYDNLSDDDFDQAVGEYFVEPTKGI